MPNLKSQTAIARFNVLLAISLVTFIVVVVLILHSIREGNRQIRDKKELIRQVAEEAIGRTFEKIAESPEDTAGFYSNLSRGVQYEVRVRVVPQDSTLREIVSAAYIGSIKRQIICRYRIVTREDGVKIPERIPDGYIID